MQPVNSEADTLLLTLEVEAAAARNADLSRIVDLLQAQLKPTGGARSYGGALSFPVNDCLSTKRLSHSDEDDLVAGVCLRKTLTEMHQLTAMLQCSAEAMNSSLEPDLHDNRTVSELATECLVQVQRLKRSLSERLQLNSDSGSAPE